jgi:septum formation protein
VSKSFVLASGSPRRRQLLADLGAMCDSLAPDVDESVLAGEPAREYVERVSASKAAAVRARLADGRLVLAADTCVVVDDEILGKPVDAEHAADMLSRLSGRTHWTTTGVTVVEPAGTETDLVETVSVATDVTFTALTPEQIRWYVASGEPLDKAGAYGIQGLAASFVERIDGSYSNVVGLPLVETIALLARHGVDIAGRQSS